MKDAPPASRALGLAAAVLIAAQAAAGAALAQTTAFAQWDLDGDGKISRHEFRLGMGTLGVYERWDSDRDGMLSDEEFRARRPEKLDDAGFLEAWGLGDEEIDRERFDEGYYAAFDRNGDRGIDKSEWRAFEAQAREEGWIER